MNPSLNFTDRAAHKGHPGIVQSQPDRLFAGAEKEAVTLLKNMEATWDYVMSVKSWERVKKPRPASHSDENIR